jgi:VanZ family protein
MAGRSAGSLMSRRLAWTLLALLVLSLAVGTQIPGALRDGIERRMHAPSALSSWAHFVIFTAMALVLSVRPLAWPGGRVLLLALTLALLTEGLQFFAVDRHPRLADVGIDMAGTLLALTFVKWKESRAAFL